MVDERACLECGTEISGRRDKRFCSSYCRTTYHNKFNQDVTGVIKATNKILRKNWRILSALNPSGKSKVSRFELLSQGFDFSYVTSYYQTKAGNTYFFCYDQGYLALADEKYALVKKQEYTSQKY